MLDFINSAFKELFTAIIWILLIIVLIGGFMAMTTPLLSFLIWIGGSIIIILSAGLVSMQIKMNENLQKIIDQGIIFNKKGVYVDGFGDVDEKDGWKCKKCGILNESYLELCKNCGNKGVFPKIKKSDIEDSIDVNNDNATTDSWLCTKCGTINEADVSVCKKCGRRIKWIL
jgi:RNA polymerase subunit RPABC4/transcription elongation factor Spt4